MEELWEELRTQRAKLEALAEELHSAKLQQTEIKGSLLRVQDSVQRLLVIQADDQADRTAFRMEFRQRMEDLAEQRGARAAAKYIWGVIVTTLGLVIAYLGVKHDLP